MNGGMRRMKIRRILVVGGGIIAALFVISSLALWIVLSSWVPIKGKARLIDELERRWPIEVSIKAMRYELVRGFVLEEVRVEDRATRTLWGAVPSMQVRLGWFRFFLGRQLVFRARALLDAPCDTQLTVAGRYHLKTQALSLEVQTSEIPLETIGEPLKRQLPPPLTGGTLRLDVRITQPPQGPVVVMGRATGQRITWASPDMRMTGDVTVTGRAAQSLAAPERWDSQAEIAFRNGSLDAPALVASITNLEGKAHWQEDRLEVDELSGTALGSRWTLEGMVQAAAHPAFEVFATSRVDLPSVASALLLPEAGWQPAGVSELQAVCRGRWPATASGEAGSRRRRSSPAMPLIDCLARAQFEDVTLKGPKLTSPVAPIAGRVAYDALTKTLTIDSLNARIQRDTIAATGTVVLGQPAVFNLGLQGTLPLDILAGWLPQDGAVTDLGGAAAFNLQLQGTSVSPQPTGRVDLRDGHLRVISTDKLIEGATGAVLLRDGRAELPRLAFQYDGQPLTLTGTATFEPTPELAVTLMFPQGQLQAEGRLTSADLVIDRASLALAESRLQLAGRLGREPSRAHLISLKGTVELADLDDLPFVPLPALTPWNLQGLADIDVQFQGRVEDWTAAALRGRLRAQRLRVRDIPVEQLTGLLDQQERTLRAQVPAALVADGKFAGELTLEHGPPTRRFLLQADLTGLRLERLAEAIPAWQQRSVTGIASGHAVVSGTPEERASWAGEGWLNASGERLGDMPLFDRLFQRGILGPLAEWLGWDLLRRAEIRQLSLQWRLAQERISTDDLRVVGVASGAAVVLYARGSVGLDQTLELEIEPELSEQIILQSRVIQEVASTLQASGLLEPLLKSIRFRVTGTLKEPKPQFERSLTELVKQLLGSSIRGFFDLFR